MSSQLLLEANNLNVRYSNQHGVSNICVKLKQGEILGLLGPNGAGKSSTLKMLSGTLLPDNGTIKVMGQTLTSENVLARKDIGYLPEHAPLYLSMTVDEYLQWAGTLHLLKQDTLDYALQKAKRRCGLNEYGHRVIKTLSKGIRQRTGIAQAIIHEPKVILLDEPTDGLDPTQIREIRHLIFELAKQAGIILSSHILPEIEACCNKVIIMNHGKIVYNGKIDALRKATGHQHLMVSFAHAICHDTLEALDCIEHVNQQSETSYLVRCPDRTIATQAVISKSTEQGWSISEIKHYDIPLEEFFEVMIKHQLHKQEDELEKTLGGL